ncbi:MAG: hypothetical protein IKV58_01115 [Oscillospiraceae bacterium]|nr:hypothetical protein [Oscillospiraceae bacterium]
MKKEIKLYNVLFPVWMLILFPVTWLVIIPGNFIVDSLVLLICMKVLKIDGKKDFYKKNILKIFALGFLADIIGSACMFGGLLLADYYNLADFVMGDEFILTIPGLLITAGLIFVLNYFISFRNCEKPLRLKLSLTFAIATAPYTFLIPSSWIY